MEQGAAVRLRERPNLRSLLIVVLVVVMIGAAATLFGWDLVGWLEDVWDTITTISIGYLIAGIALITIQTDGGRVRLVLDPALRLPGRRCAGSRSCACYATAVALNFVLPANIGTLVMMLMFTTIIVAATFAGVLAGYVVQKVFFTAIGAATYLYLFLSVGGSFSIQFGFIEEHPWAFVILLGGGRRAAVPRVPDPAPAHRESGGRRRRTAGRSLAKPRRYLLLVAAPEAVSWLAMLGTIARVPRRVRHPRHLPHADERHGRQLDREHDIGDPGRRGRRRRASTSLSLRSVTSSSNATAYSVAQQLVETAWSIALAILLLVRAFGWTGGPRARAAVLRPGQGEGGRRVGGAARAPGDPARRERAGHRSA